MLAILDPGSAVTIAVPLRSPYVLPETWVFSVVRGKTVWHSSEPAVSRCDEAGVNSSGGNGIWGAMYLDHPCAERRGLDFDNTGTIGDVDSACVELISDFSVRGSRAMRIRSSNFEQLGR